LTQAFASQWRPFDPEVSWALKERAQLAGRNTDDVKLEAMRVGLFLALRQLSRVQKVQLGQTRDTVVVDDGILMLCGRDGSVRDGYAGLTHLEPLPRPMSAVRAVILSYGSWLRDAQDRVFVAYVGPTRPLDLRPEQRLHWLRCRAIRHAEEWIRDEQLSAKSGVCDITDLDPADETQSPLDALVAAEEHVERLAEIYGLATTKQRQILDVLDGLMRSGLDIPDAKRLAAKELDIQVGAIDTAMSRLRTRVRAANRL
jgi:DNA-directed RNA polymerase specialized sigma24 family protein